MTNKLNEKTNKINNNCPLLLLFPRNVYLEKILPRPSPPYGELFEKLTAKGVRGKGAAKETKSSCFPFLLVAHLNVESHYCPWGQKRYASLCHKSQPHMWKSDHVFSCLAVVETHLSLWLKSMGHKSTTYGGLFTWPSVAGWECGKYFKPAHASQNGSHCEMAVCTLCRDKASSIQSRLHWLDAIRMFLTTNSHQSQAELHTKYRILEHFFGGIFRLNLKCFRFLMTVC